MKIFKMFDYFSLDFLKSKEGFIKAAACKRIEFFL